MIDFKEMMLGFPRKLAHTYRYNTVPVIHRESVDSHTYHTALYAVLIAHHLESINPSLKINWKFLSISSLVHDIDESMNGDVLRHVKRYSKTLHKEWTAMCKDSVNKISTKLVGDDSLTYYWENDKNEEMIEGLIIAISDFLSVFSYTHEEVTKGNSHIQNTLMDSSRYIFEYITKVVTTDHPLYSIVRQLFAAIHSVLEDVRCHLNPEYSLVCNDVILIYGDYLKVSGKDVYELYMFDRRQLGDSLDMMTYFLDEKRDSLKVKLSSLGSIKFDMSDYDRDLGESLITSSNKIRHLAHSDTWPDYILKTDKGDYLWLSNNPAYYAFVRIEGSVEESYVSFFTGIKIMNGGQCERAANISRQLQIESLSGTSPAKQLV